MTTRTTLPSTAGRIVLWRLRNSAVTPDTLRDILATENFPIQVPDIDAASAVRRVGNSFESGRGEERHYAQVTGDDGTVIDIAIVHKRVDPSASVGSKAKPVQVETISFDVGGDMWLNLPRTEAGKVLVEKCDKARKYLDHSFIRPHILEAQLSNLRGFRLKEGVYWVMEDPNTQDVINRLKAVLCQINNCRLRDFRLDSADAGTVRDVQEDGTDSLSLQLDDLIAKIRKWEAGPRRARRDAVETVIAEFVELKSNAELFQDMLQVSLDDLMATMESASETARKLIDDEDDEWKASPGLVRAFDILIENAQAEGQEEDGVITLTAEDLTDAIDSNLVPASAAKHAAYYSRTNGGGRALGHLGYRGSLREGVLSVRTLAPKRSLENATPGSMEERLVNMGGDVLRNVYSASLGSPPPAEMDDDGMRQAVLTALG